MGLPVTPRQEILLAALIAAAATAAATWVVTSSYYLDQAARNEELRANRDLWMHAARGASDLRALDDVLRGLVLDTARNGSARAAGLFQAMELRGTLEFHVTALLQTYEGTNESNRVIWLGLRAINLAVLGFRPFAEELLASGALARSGTDVVANVTTDALAFAIHLRQIEAGYALSAPLSRYGLDPLSAIDPADYAGLHTVALHAACIANRFLSAADLASCAAATAP